MSHNHDDEDGEGVSRRHALECMLWAGTGVLWAVSGGVPKSLGLLEPAAAATAAATGFTFLQISDSHIGFDKAANPHAIATSAKSEIYFEVGVSAMRGGIGERLMGNSASTATMIGYTSSSANLMVISRRRRRAYPAGWRIQSMASGRIALNYAE